MEVKKHLGATYIGDGHCDFLVWAPLVRKMEVHFTMPEEKTVLLKKDKHGYHQGMINGIIPGSLYFYQMDDTKYLDEGINLTGPFWGMIIVGSENDIYKHGDPDHFGLYVNCSIHY